MAESLKHKTIRGFWWSGIERFSSQGITIILGIFIARLLSPSDYGVIAMLSIFFAIFNTFVDSGFSIALVRKTNRTESDNSTVFYFNIAVGFVVSLLFFLLAPLIADFFEIPLLAPITQVLSLTVFINSFGVVQQAILTARIDFKTQAKISLLTALVSGGLGLWSAIAGYGVWALVIQMLSASFLKSGLLWLIVRWKPCQPFSKKSFLSFFSFGSKLLTSALIDIIYSNLYTLIIGKVFSASNLGYYSRASQLAQFPTNNILSIIQRVSFPVMSTMQNENERLAVNYGKILRMSTFIIFPLMVGLAVIAHPLIVSLLTSKWVGAVIFLQIICFEQMCYPVHFVNLSLLQAKGRSDLYLKLEIVKKAIGVTILCITIPMGLLPMCYGQVLISIICMFVNAYYTGKLIDFGFLKQMKEILPSLFSSLVMGAIVFSILPLFLSEILQLIVGVFTGVISYILIAYLFNLREISYIKEIIAK